MLTSPPAGATEYIDADLRDTRAILGRARQVLDFTRPVAATLLAPCQRDEEAEQLALART